MIANHYSAKLSELDMRMVRSIPEGGNWKNIPTDIPSKRLDQIRESFLRGEGSRSTYYGRLDRNMPSYTISTYFSRPGNGCHIHYEQDRVLSHREAARLQSFPDRFEFMGSKSAVSTQIGNAVPPLLAFQFAKSLGEPGVFIDLFCGAGGMGLGFKWAGWDPVISNDIHPTYLSTYAKNVHHHTILGSISEPEVFQALLDAAQSARASGLPFWVLGGPPCQGFSTAGNARSMKDPRNSLVWDYIKFLNKAKPDGFVFENVPGILSMEKGLVFKAVHEAFSAVSKHLHHAVFSTENFGIPQRRKRVIIVGHSREQGDTWSPPPATSARYQDGDHQHFAKWVGVKEAMDDLPRIASGEDGSHYDYAHAPENAYQMLMRNHISPEEYMNAISNRG